MGYKSGCDVLPPELLCAVQEYVDGSYLYIPRKKTGTLPWGTATGIRRTLQERNREIAAKRRAGRSAAQLAGDYFLSEKTIHKILRAAQAV